MYFIGCLLFKVLLLCVLVVGGICTVFQIRRGKVSPKYYLLVVLILLFTPILVVDVASKASDIGSLNRKEYVMVEGQCTAVSRTGVEKEVMVEGGWYEYNPWDFEPQVGVIYKIYVLPKSNYIAKWENLG